MYIPAALNQVARWGILINTFCTKMIIQSKSSFRNTLPKLLPTQQISRKTSLVGEKQESNHQELSSNRKTSQVSQINR